MIKLLGLVTIHSVQKREEGYELYGMINVSKGCRKDPEAFVLRFSLVKVPLWLNIPQSQQVFSCGVAPSRPASRRWFGSGLRVHKKCRQTEKDVESGFSPFSAKTTLLFAQLGPTGRHTRERNGRRCVAGAAQACRTTPVCLLLDFSV